MLRVVAVVETMDSLKMEIRKLNKTTFEINTRNRKLTGWIVFMSWFIANIKELKSFEKKELLDELFREDVTPQEIRNVNRLLGLGLRAASRARSPNHDGNEKGSNNEVSLN